MTALATLVADEPTPISIADDIFEMTPTGLKAKREYSYSEWEAIGWRIWFGYNAYKWALADWLEFGEQKFGEKYAAAIVLTGYKEQTLANYAYTARHIPQSSRRETVSFSNHSEVASLPEHEREYALDMLQSGEWNREQVRKHKRQLKGTSTPVETTISLQCKGFKLADGVLTVAFVAPSEVFEIVGYKAVVRSKPQESRVAA